MLSAEQQASDLERAVPDAGPLSKAQPIDPGMTSEIRLDMAD